MKNYSQKTNKKMTRYRTSSTFRGNVKFSQNKNVSLLGKKHYTGHNDQEKYPYSQNQDLKS